MTGWFGRNRWYLLAFVVLVPAAVYVSLLPRWFPYQRTLPQYELVERAETVAYSGAEISLTALQLLDGDEWGAPVGADIVVATLTIDVIDPQETYCEVELISTEGGLERIWPAAVGDSGDYDIPDEFSNQCSFAEAGAYELQLTFEVPADQVPNADVVVSSSVELPRVLRLN